MAANFVESATLRVIDRSTAPINKINAALRRLQQTAKAMKSINIAGGNTSGLRSMSAAIRRVNQDMERMRASMRSMGRAGGSPFSASGINQATAAVNRLTAAYNRAAAASARIRPPPAGGGFGGGRGGGTPPIGPRRVWWSGFGGSSGFSPNASVIDRIQYRLINEAEAALARGAMEIDVARIYGSMINTPENQAHAEAVVADILKRYGETTRGNLLQLWHEASTNFAEATDADVLLPELAKTIRLSSLQGADVNQAQDGIIRLVKMLAAAGKLTNTSGRLNADEALAILDAYNRAKLILGKDIDPNQAFLMAKYSRTAGQTMTPDAWLTSFLLAGDVRGSSLGNMIDQVIKQLTGRATKTAMAEQAKYGLITGEIMAQTPEGPGQFVMTGITDEEVLRENPYAWFYAKFLGPEGVLAKHGLDASTATAAQVADVMSKFFSRATAEDLANKIINQYAELATQREKALGFDLSDEWLADRATSSLNRSLSGVAQSLATLFGDLSENLKFVTLPALNLFERAMAGISRDLASDDINYKIRGIASGLLLGGASYVAANPGTAAMIGAAVMHTRAAAALMAAAAALSGSRLGGMLGLGAGGLLGGRLRRLRGVGKSLGGGLLGLVAWTIADTIVDDVLNSAREAEGSGRATSHGWLSADPSARNALIDKIQAIKNWGFAGAALGSFGGLTGTLVGAFGGMLAGAAWEFRDKIGEAISAAVNGALSRSKGGREFGSEFGPIGSVLGTHYDLFVGANKWALEVLEGAGRWVWKSIADAFDGIGKPRADGGSMLGDLTARIGEATSGLDLDPIMSAVGDALDSFGNAWATFWDRVTARIEEEATRLAEKAKGYIASLFGEEEPSQGHPPGGLRGPGGMGGVPSPGDRPGWDGSYRFGETFLPSAESYAAAIEGAISGGAAAGAPILQAGVAAGADGAGGKIGSAMIGAAGTAGGIIAAAISGAAANIRVNVHQAPGANTGRNPILGHV